jgi:hypothetical protein
MAIYLYNYTLLNTRLKDNNEIISPNKMFIS